MQQPEFSKLQISSQLTDNNLFVYPWDADSTINLLKSASVWDVHKNATFYGQKSPIYSVQSEAETNYL